MRAVRIHQFGPPEVLQIDDVPLPALASGEILVRVAASGVGPWDALIRSGGSALAQHLPLTLGSDFAGSVAAVDPSVAELRVGDPVFGSTFGFVGAYADFVAVPQGKVAPKPARIGDIEAASVPVVAVTALQMLDRAGPIAGKAVLIHGAAGGVGSFAVQLAAQRGARVIANAAPADEPYVRELGAHAVVDLRSQGFQAVREPIDIVLDLIGGNVQRQSLEVLKRGGSLISVVAPPDAAEAQRYAVNASFFYVDVRTSDLQEIARALDSDTLRVTVGTVLPLQDARIAHKMLAGDRPRPRGKIVLTVGADRSRRTPFQPTMAG